MENMHDRTRRSRARVAFVDRFALVAETFEVATRSLCVPIPVLVDQGASRSAVAAAVLAARPDVAVLTLDGVVADENLPVEELVDAGVITAVLTFEVEDSRLGDLVRRGAHAALGGDSGLAGLVDVIARVVESRPAMESAELDRLQQSQRPDAAPGPAARVADERDAARLLLAGLTSREGEVLRCLMGGRSPAEIARSSFVSEATVRTQVRSINRKLGVGSQLSAVAVAYRGGWRPERTETLSSTSFAS